MFTLHDFHKLFCVININYFVLLILLLILTLILTKILARCLVTLMLTFHDINTLFGVIIVNFA